MQFKPKIYKHCIELYHEIRKKKLSTIFSCIIFVTTHVRKLLC